MFWRRPWQSIAAHQGAAAPSLGTSALRNKKFGGDIGSRNEENNVDSFIDDLIIHTND